MESLIQLLHTSKPLGKLTMGWIIALVVLAVIGLTTFAGIRSRTDDKRVNLSKSNMKSLGLHILRYANDHGGRLPASAGQDWVVDAEDYIVSQAELYSPFDLNKHSWQEIRRDLEARGKHANPHDVFAELRKRQERLTDYELTNDAAGRQFDQLPPTTILLIDTSSSKDGTLLCLRADFHFQRVTQVAADQMLYSPRKQ